MSEPFQNITIAKNKIRILNPCDSCPNECRPLHTKVRRGAKILVLTSGPNTYLRVARQLIMRDEAQRAFDTYAHKAGFVATDFIFHPIVKCYFDKESTPKKQRTNIELQCREFVLRVIEALKPEVIITLGVDALKTVYGKQKRVLKSRGQLEWIEDYQAYVYPMLDPEYVVMYPQNAKIFEADWMRLQSLRNNGYDEASTTQDLVGEYEIVDDLQFIVDADPPVIAFDTETEGLRWIAPDKDLLTMQFCWEPGKAYMLSWDHPDRPLPRRKRQRVKEQLRQILCKPGRSIVGHNLKYDAMWVWAKLGIRMRIDQDTLMLTTLLDENMVSKDLSTLTKVLLPHMAGYDDLFNRTYDKSDMASIPLDQILAYGCGDTDATLQIYEIQSERVYQDEALWNHYRTVSIPGLNMFMSMERFGMPVDESKLDELEVDLALYLESVYADLMDAIPQSIKIEHVSKGKALKFSRADFLIDILFRHPDGFRLTPRVFTKTTEKLAPELRVPSTSSKNHLPFFFDECPFTEQLAEYIKLERLLTTNVQGFRENYIIDGHVYPSYGLHVTVTGRSNSQDPNCFPGYVEVLTDAGWRRFDSVPRGAKIAQYDVGTEHIDFADPVETIKQPFHGELLRISTDQQIDIVCTANHRFVTRNRKNKKLYRSTAAIYPKDAYQPQAGYGVGGNVSMSRDEITLICALQADAYVNGSGGIDWRFSKKCKAKRLASAFVACRIPFRAYRSGRGQYGFYLSAKNTPEWLRGRKHFDYSILKFDAVTLANFCDELWYWDGDFTRGSTWTSTVKQNADVVQAAFALCGKRAWVRESSNSTCKKFYVVNVTDKTHSSTANRRIDNVPYTGYVHCYTMPKGTLVVRHNGKVVITENSQNYPKRGSFAKTYRSIFAAPPGKIIVQADLSQAELRIAADMANERTMLGIYRVNGDVHLSTALEASRMSKEEFDALSAEERDLSRFKAKAVNFGFLYGMWWRKFVLYAKTQYGVEFTEAEAQDLRESFFRLYSGLESWHEATRQFARRHKMVRSYSGRIRHLPMIDSVEDYIKQEAERQAINSPVQEFASTLGIVAASMIDQSIDPRYLSLGGFVHDALITYTNPEHVQWAAWTLKRYMENVPIRELFGRTMRVPIVADVSFGQDAGHQFEMKGLVTGEPYDFSRTKPEMDFRLPRQKIPPRDGRIVLPEYMRHAEYEGLV